MIVFFYDLTVSVLDLEKYTKNNKSLQIFKTCFLYVLTVASVVSSKYWFLHEIKFVMAVVFLFFIFQLSGNHNPKSICIFKHIEKCLFELGMIYKVSLFLYAICITFLSLILIWMPFFESVTIILAFYLYNFSACQEYVFFFLFVMHQNLPESMNHLSETSSNLLLCNIRWLWHVLRKYK